MPYDPNKTPSAVKPEPKEGKREAYFIDQVSTTDVELLHAPSEDDMMKWFPGWATLTWSDVPGESPTHDAVKDDVIEYAMQMKVLPSILETVNCVFLFTGLSQICSTHILRHRTMSFSGQSTDARDCRDDPFVLPPELYYGKYTADVRELHQRALDLYILMVENDDVSREHARYVLPRSSETSLYARVNLKDAIGFIKTRLDKSTQPLADNVWAACMLRELLKWDKRVWFLFSRRPFPQTVDDVLNELDPVHPLFLSSVQTPVAHALHPPEAGSNADKAFDWCYEDFITRKTKSEYEGFDVYESRMRVLATQILRATL